MGGSWGRKAEAKVACVLCQERSGGGSFCGGEINPAGCNHHRVPRRALLGGTGALAVCTGANVTRPECATEQAVASAATARVIGLSHGELCTHTHTHKTNHTHTTNQTDAHTNTRAFTPMRTQACTHMWTHTQPHMHTDPHTGIYTYICVHTHAVHTRIPTHIHSQPLFLDLGSIQGLPR